MHALAIPVLFVFYVSASALPVNGVDDPIPQLYVEDWVQDDCDVDLPSSTLLTVMSSSSILLPSLSSASRLSSYASVETIIPVTVSSKYTPPSTTSLAQTLPLSDGPLTSTITSSATATTIVATSGKYPFSQVVAFGDNLSDNGNGEFSISDFQCC